MARGFAARMRRNKDRAASYLGSGVIGGGVPLPPIIYTSSSFTVGENTLNLIDLDADQAVLWTKVGGADAAIYQLVGDQLTLPAQNYEAPADADANNVYVVRLRATSIASGLWTEFTIVGTVTDVAEGGGSAVALSSPQVSADGSMILFAISGGLWGGEIKVDPSLVAVSMTAPTSDGTGNAGTASFGRRVGFAAELVGGKLAVWMREAIPQAATNVTVTVGDNAITAGVDRNAALAPALVTNGSSRVLPAVTARIVGVTEGRASIKGPQEVVNADFAIEVFADPTEGIAHVKFELLSADAATVLWSGYTTAWSRSRYQDTRVIDNAQWDANRGATQLGGEGVLSSGSITLAGKPEGPALARATVVAKMGGAATARVLTWPINLNSAGGYTERSRYVDPQNRSGVASDNNDGLTAQTPFLTMAKAIQQAGAFRDGANALTGVTAKTVPIVKVLPGPSAADPQIISNFGGNSGTTAVNAGQTDAYLVVQPAEGGTRDTVWFAPYLNTGTGQVNRVRRLCMKDIGVDIANQPGTAGIGSSGLLSPQQSLYPVTDPQAIMLRGCRVFHHLGKNGQINEGNNGFIWTSFGKQHFITYFDVDVVEMYQRGIQTNASFLGRNIFLDNVAKDILKEPDCMFSFVARRNKVAPLKLPTGGVTGTPEAGEMMLGLLSGYQAPFASMTGATVFLADGYDAVNFKRDDTFTHQLLTVTGGAGTFQIGETVSSSNASGIVRRVEANGQLRVSTVSGTFATTGTPANITGQTSGATRTVTANKTQGNILFLTSGANATAQMPHPDGFQIQSFKNQQAVISDVVGAFATGELLQYYDAVGQKWVYFGTVVRFENATNIVTAGNVLFSNLPTGTLFRGGTGSASSLTPNGNTFTYQSRVGYVDNDVNAIYANGRFEDCDGQLLYGENGSKGILVANVIGIRTDLVGSYNSGLYDLPETTFLQCSLPNQRMNTSGRGYAGNKFLYSIVASLTSGGVVPAGAAASVFRGVPGIDISGNHSLDVSTYRSLKDGMTTGDALWINGTLVSEGYNDAKKDFRPGSGSPAIGRIPASEAGRVLPFDILGRARKLDGTGAAGVLEAA